MLPLHLHGWKSGSVFVPSPRHILQVSPSPKLPLWPFDEPEKTESFMTSNDAVPWPAERGPELASMLLQPNNDCHGQSLVVRVKRGEVVDECRRQFLVPYTYRSPAAGNTSTRAVIRTIMAGHRKLEHHNHKMASQRQVDIRDGAINDTVWIYLNIPSR